MNTYRKNLIRTTADSTYQTGNSCLLEESSTDPRTKTDRKGHAVLSILILLCCRMRCLITGYLTTCSSPTIGYRISLLFTCRIRSPRMRNFNTCRSLLASPVGRSVRAPRPSQPLPRGRRRTACSLCRRLPFTGDDRRRYPASFSEADVIIVSFSCFFHTSYRK